MNGKRKVQDQVLRIYICTVIIIYNILSLIQMFTLTQTKQCLFNLFVSDMLPICLVTITIALH